MPKIKGKLQVNQNPQRELYLTRLFFMKETKFNGMFPFFKGIEMIETKKLYYFKLLKHIFDGKYHLEKVLRCYCSSTDLELLSIQDRFALPFGSKICKTCGLIQQSPRLSGKDLPDFYDEIYWGLILDLDKNEMSTVDRKILSYLDEYVLEKFKNKTATVIEIGCGSGLKLEEIKKLFEINHIQVNVLGCDYSENAIKKAKEKHIEVYKGGVNSLIGKTADIVILSHVVEHFNDIKAEFEEIKKLLKTESYLYIEVPGVGDLVNKSEYGYNYLVYSVMAHTYNFNLTSLRSVIEPLGFEFIAGDEYVRSIFCFNPSHRFAVDVSRNYEQTMSSIQKAEEKRMKIEMSNISKFKKLIRDVVKKVFKIY